MALTFSASYAWSGRGHEQVADVAWTQLTPEVKQEIAKILNAGDSDFRPFGEGDSDVRAAFRKAAVWPDWIKGNTGGAYEDQIKVWNEMFQPGYNPDDTDREAHRCKRWHYFDVPIHFQGKKPEVEGSNALIALTTARYELTQLKFKNPRDLKTECWWLYWIEHVVGDLHQPLHCVSSFKFEPTGDAGGNLFKLGVGTPDNPDRKFNLHSLWDQGAEAAIALEAGQPSDAEAVTERWTSAFPPSASDVKERSFGKWIAAGAKLAEEVVYPGIERDGTPSTEYKAKQAETTKRQIVLAGYRLANTLNECLSPSS